MGGTVSAGRGRSDREIRVLADKADSCEFKTFWEVPWNGLAVISTGISRQASYNSCKVDSFWDPSETGEDAALLLLWQPAYMGWEQPAASLLYKATSCRAAKGVPCRATGDRSH